MRRVLRSCVRYGVLSSLPLIIFAGAYSAAGCGYSDSVINDAARSRPTPVATAMSDNRNVERTAAPEGLRLVLTAEDPLWSSDKPAHVLLRIENTGDKTVTLATRGSFILVKEGAGGSTEKETHTFYSSFLPLQKEGSQEKENLQRQLEAGQAVDLPLDIATLKWGRIISAMRPDKGFFEVVPPGRYLLHFEFREKIGSRKLPGTSTEVPLSKTYESNKLTVSIR